MADDAYVSGKIREALARSAGDQKLAQRLLLGWCAGDGKLLLGLVRPFLAGIVAHAVQRATGRAAAGPNRALTPQALDTLVGQLGRTIGTTTPPRGMSALLEAPMPTKAGAGHEQSLRKLAAAFARKRLDR